MNFVANDLGPNPMELNKCIDSDSSPDGGKRSICDVECEIIPPSKYMRTVSDSSTLDYYLDNFCSEFDDYFDVSPVSISSDYTSGWEGCVLPDNFFDDQDVVQNDNPTDNQDVEQFFETLTVDQDVVQEAEQFIESLPFKLPPIPTPPQLSFVSELVVPEPEPTTVPEQRSEPAIVSPEPTIVQPTSPTPDAKPRTYQRTVGVGNCPGFHNTRIAASVAVLKGDIETIRECDRYGILPFKIAITVAIRLWKREVVSVLCELGTLVPRRSTKGYRYNFKDELIDSLDKLKVIQWEHPIILIHPSLAEGYETNVRNMLNHVVCTSPPHNLIMSTLCETHNLYDVSILFFARYRKILNRWKGGKEYTKPTIFVESLVLFWSDHQKRKDLAIRHLSFFRFILATMARSEYGIFSLMLCSCSDENIEYYITIEQIDLSDTNENSLGYKIVRDLAMFKKTTLILKLIIDKTKNLVHDFCASRINPKTGNVYELVHKYLSGEYEHPILGPMNDTMHDSVVSWMAGSGVASSDRYRLKNGINIETFRSGVGHFLMSKSTKLYGMVVKKIETRIAYFLYNNKNHGLTYESLMEVCNFFHIKNFGIEICRNSEIE